MLDDNKRITKITQPQQRIEEFAIITLMQTNARFIENIHHANQPGANLRSEADALCFATRKSWRSAIKCQIVQTYIV
jgi:hypothetical protein